MPSLVYSAQRATETLHAPWWSPVRTQDGTRTTPEIPEDQPGGVYLERCVIYREMLEADQSWIQLKMLKKGNLGKNGNPITPEELAKANTYTLLRMIVELTDATGTAQPVTEQTLGYMTRRDAQFIADAIAEDNVSPVEVTPEDEAQAERNAARGYPDPVLHTPEGVAVRRFPDPRDAILPG